MHLGQQVKLLRKLIKMKTIIAGSREITSTHVVRLAVEESGFAISEIVSGGARGVDRIGIWVAESFNLPIKVMDADWELNGKSAGFIRNISMAEYADALIAVWDGKSSGTKHMIEEAKKKGLKVFVKVVE